MDTQYDIHIDGVTRSEYIQAGSESIRRMVPTLLVLVAVLTPAIALIIDDFSLRSLLPPFLIALAVPLVMWLSVVMSWRKFPADTKFSYLIDSDGWQLTVGDASANIDWQDTVRMVVRSHVVLLFQETNRSNILPRRSLTQEQLEQLRAWFADSRPAYKARCKEKEEEFRQARRQRQAAQQSGRKSRWGR